MSLVAEKLSIGYGTDKRVFENISFCTQASDLITLIGVNGIGKSTLLRTIAGLQKKTSGSLKFNSREISEMNTAERATLISVVLTDRIFIDHITAEEFIALGRMPYTGWFGNLNEEDKKTIDTIIEMLAIHHLRKREFNQMSDGERQKVAIGRALAQQTPLLLLDEPTAFLDFKSKTNLLAMLQKICRELNKTIILSTHDIEAAIPIANKCWVMTEEKKFYETAADLKDVKQLVM